MEITLYRTRTKADTTDGELWINHKKVCDTAEATPFCLEPGIYQIMTRFVRRFGRSMPIIKDTDGIIMMGNGSRTLRDASIILGKHLLYVPGVVTHSRNAFEPLYQRIRKTLDRKKEVTLIIK